MRYPLRNGYTLVEVTIAAAIMGTFMAALSGFVRGATTTHETLSVRGTLDD
jgi:prepilin-type N-terminal cleavage/methylation domain-containing protein